MRGCFVSILMLWALAGFAQEPLEYELQFEASRPGKIRIRITVPAGLPGPRPFVFPRAVPMGYSEQPFDSFVGNVKASDGAGRSAACPRIDGPRWIAGREGSVIRRVEYEVDVARMEREILSAADASKARERYASFLGYTVFGFLEGTEHRPIRLNVVAPADWPVFLTLAPRAPPDRGSASAGARNFYALADSQILLGPDLVARRLAGEFPLFLAAYAEGEADLRQLGEIAAEAFSATAAYFGRNPLVHYTLCQEYLRPVSDRHGYGFSMEHLESCTVFFAADQALTSRSGEEEVQRVRYNLAHHMAHSWIPKRSYGEGYFPFRWERAPVIDTIWFSEGFPQYAAIEALADRMSPADGRAYRDRMLANRFRRNLEEAPEFIRKLSLLDLSRLASTRYSEDFRIGRNIFSRGGLMAAEMDERIRSESGGNKRLRDALRYLVSWSEASGRAFRIEELTAIFARATGVDTGDILQRWLPAPAR
ncbi:MAG: hypothetical protein FJW35_10785 [Acidobacteria bacterium]|nr:hypothetical protein [Acidobacteriota bacterium]